MLLEAGALKRLEPELAGAAALLSPSTGIIDSHQLMACFRADTEAAAAQWPRSTRRCSAGPAEGDRIRLHVGGREPVDVEARLAVNCAGLGASDRFGGMEGVDPATIPRAGSPRATIFRCRAAPPPGGSSIPCRNPVDWACI